MEESPAPDVPAAAGEAPRAPVVLPKDPGPATLAEVFESEESALLGYAIGLAGRRELAEDLVQEAFLRMHEVWRDVENPRAWLFRCVRNLALNHLRDHRRETTIEGREEPAGGELPDETLGRMEVAGTVRMLIAEMAQDDRELIRMKYHEEMKYAEISKRTGLSVGNVGYRLHHLLKGLAESLRHTGIEGSRG